MGGTCSTRPNNHVTMASNPVKQEAKEQVPEDLDYVLERKRYLYETDACVCVTDLTMQSVKQPRTEPPFGVTRRARESGWYRNYFYKC